jgi:hypothetical protein
MVYINGWNLPVISVDKKQVLQTFKPGSVVTVVFVMVYVQIVSSCFTSGILN